MLNTYVYETALPKKGRRKTCLDKPFYTCVKWMLGTLKALKKNQVLGANY